MDAMKVNSVSVHMWVIWVAFLIGVGLDSFLGKLISFIKFLRNR